MSCPTFDKVRSRDPNGAVLLEFALQNINWSVMESCEAMVEFFYDKVITFVNHFLLLREVTENGNDKSRLTEEFRCVIHCC